MCEGMSGLLCSLSGLNELNKMKHLALFNGIGGFQLAAHWMGWSNVAHVEIDEWCNRVVKKHFPDSICHTDIRNFDGTQYTNTIDILTGGFPCQPFSVAGQRKGKEDARHLWPEMFRVIKEVRPTWIVGENVTGIIGLALEQVLSDLESAGYHTETFIIPACAVGALHKRDRLWIVAHTNGKRWEDEQKENRKSLRDRKRNNPIKEQSRKFEQCRVSEPSTILSDTESIGREQSRHSRKRGTGFENNDSNDGGALSNSNGIGWENGLHGQEQEGQTTEFRNSYPELDGRTYWEVEPELGRVANGIPRRVDRIRGLGNAIVPQVALEIFRAINKTLVV
jgi:DNA (cytosine-5)-methyltransferase 1